MDGDPSVTFSRGTLVCRDLGSIIKGCFFMANSPNLFIVGAAKSGTSSLAHYLGNHPDIFVSDIKEPFFYIDGIGINDRREYLTLFNKARQHKILAEATTGYLFDEKSAYRIKSDYPDAKIIIMLRNPPDMAFSYWQYMQACGNEALPFMQAISDAVREYRWSDEFKRNCINWWASYIYVDRAMYYKQVKRYFDVFGVGSVKVYIFEESINDMGQVLTDIYDFLEVDAGFKQDINLVKNRGGALRSKFVRDSIYNREYPILKRILPARIREFIRFSVRDLNRSSSEKLSILDEEREFLRAVFEPDILQLESLLGRRIDAWR